MLVLTGLMDHNGNALGDGGGDHARAGGSFLTGIHPAKTVGQGHSKPASRSTRSRQTPSARRRGCARSSSAARTRARSATATRATAARTRTASRGAGRRRRIPRRRIPRAVFERLFGADDITLPPEVRAKRLADRKSILDSVQDQVRAMLGTVGGADRHKLDEYLTAVREIEMQLEAAEQKQAVELTPDFEKPDGVPFEYAAYVKIMLDLAAIAFQADITQNRHGGARARRQPADLQRNRRLGRPSPALAPWQSARVAREAVEDQPVPHADRVAVHRAYEGDRRR